MSEIEGVTPDDVKALLDIATQSLDFSSGFLDDEEVALLRRVAEAVGVDPMAVTPENFKRRFEPKGKTTRAPGRDYAHDYREWKPDRCFWCTHGEDHPLHHGVDRVKP